MEKQERSLGLRNLTGNTARCLLCSGNTVGSQETTPDVCLLRVLPHAAWVPQALTIPSLLETLKATGQSHRPRGCCLSTSPPASLSLPTALPCSLEAPGQKAASTRCAWHTCRPPASPPGTQPRSCWREGWHEQQHGRRVGRGGGQWETPGLVQAVSSSMFLTLFRTGGSRR